MDEARSPIAARPVGDDTEAAAKLQQELADFITHMRHARVTMEDQEFTRYLGLIGMDAATAQDFLASDGSIDSMTDRMWVFFESPLKPRRAPLA